MVIYHSFGRLIEIVTKKTAHTNDGKLTTVIIFDLFFFNLVFKKK